MDEYSRIVIVEYCYNSKRKSKKVDFLTYLINGSYDLGFELSDDDVFLLESYINKERNSELKEAMEELLNYLTCY